jgi:hypothetical protein
MRPAACASAGLIRSLGAGQYPMATYQKTKAYEGAEDAKVRPPALDAQCIGADGMMSHGYHEPDDGMPRGAAPRIDSGFTLGE